MKGWSYGWSVPSHQCAGIRPSLHPRLRRWASSRGGNTASLRRPASQARRIAVLGAQRLDGMEHFTILAVGPGQLEEPEKEPPPVAVSADEGPALRAKRRARGQCHEIVDPSPQQRRAQTPGRLLRWASSRDFGPVSLRESEAPGEARLLCGAPEGRRPASQARRIAVLGAQRLDGMEHFTILAAGPGRLRDSAPSLPPRTPLRASRPSARP